MRRFLVWSMRVLSSAFLCVVVFGAWALVSGTAWGQGVGNGGGASGLVVTRNYGEGARAVWWMRSPGPGVGGVGGPNPQWRRGVLFGRRQPPTHPRQPHPHPWGFGVPGLNRGMGTGGGCAAQGRGVGEDEGGGVRVKVQFTPQ